MNFDGGSEVPEACTLPVVEQPIRVSELGEFFRTSAAGATRVESTVLEVVLVPGVEQYARELTARESACCSFFDFEFGMAGGEAVLRIGVPEAHVDILDAIERRVRE